MKLFAGGRRERGTRHSRSAERERRRRSSSPRQRRRSGSRSPRRAEHQRRGTRSPPRRPSRSRSPQQQHGRHHHQQQQRRYSPPRPHSRSRSPLQRPGGGSDRFPRQAGGRDYGTSHRGHMQEQDRPPPQRGYGGGGGRGGGPGSEEPPPVGSIHHAAVVSIRPFGAFVELPGFRKQGLVHHSQISDEIHFGRDDDDETKVKALEFFLPQGEKVWVKVTEVRQEEGRDARVGCSMRAVDQETGADLDPSGLLTAPRSGGRGAGGPPESEEPPEVNTVHAAAVQQLRPFGAFVKLEGYRRYGLVHVSQISDHMDMSREDTDDLKVAAISAVLAIGEKVFVKVVDVKQDERGPKIGCSIKLVSQRDGTDLDPHNLKYRPRQEGGGPGGREAIGAHVAETHGDAVDWGHMKADVVQYGGADRRYDILADDSPPRGAVAAGRGPHPPVAGAGGGRGPPPGEAALAPR
ncbi:hypothetical protein N2152v2_000023 [Parachlorella kessleri]